MTIFFAIDRGLVARNILRCGVLDHVLARPDTRVVLLLPKRPGGIPDYFRQEFSDPRITLEEVPERHDSFWLSRIWLPVINNLVYSQHTDMLARVGSGKVKPVPSWWYPIHSRLFRLLSRFSFLKRVVREIDYQAFRPSKGFDALFARYKPDVVFCGSIISKYDIAIMKAARRHGVPSIGMQKGWDNLQRQLIRHVPDILLIQNPLMTKAAEQVQMIPSTRLRLVGFPQFDAYTQAHKRPTSEVKTIFFGSEGVWTPDDHQLVERLIAWHTSGAFPFPTRLIIRPHFSAVARNTYERFRNIPGVVVDDAYRFGTFFSDTWDPSREDQAHFVDELLGADVVVAVASTLSLDAACVDVPIINIAYGAYSAQGVDLTANLYKADHYLPVLASEAVELVRSDEELFSAVVRSIQDPTYRSEGRKRLRETMCGLLDGQSASRIAHELLSIQPSSFDRLPVRCPVCASNTVCELDRRTTKEGHLLRTIVCTACTHAFLSPRASDEEYQAYYASGFSKEFNQIAPQVDLVRLAESNRAKTERLLKFVSPKVRPGSRILEIGAGYGNVLAGLRATQPRALDGIEVDPMALRVAREVHGLELFPGTLETFIETWQGEPYDVILMHHVLEHMLDLPRVASCLQKLSHTGTLLYVGVPNIRALMVPKDLFFRFPHVHYFSPPSLAQYLRDVGFLVIDPGANLRKQLTYLATYDTATDPCLTDQLIRGRESVFTTRARLFVQDKRQCFRLFIRDRVRPMAPSWIKQVVRARRARVL